MTHEDIYRKFMIEYDKANISTSYPSLTKYEIATVLDKAYLALIAQKVTGANFRKSTFEADVKSIEDMRPLIIRLSASKSSKVSSVVNNEYVYDIPEGILYILEGYISTSTKGIYTAPLLAHAIAQKYKASPTNQPWLQSPIMYVENDKLYLLTDILQYPDPNKEMYDQISLLAIKQPNKFVDMLMSDINESDKMFELNDSMAEELINLAIIMSLEIVESSRLNNKISTSQLES